jgi:hypothetical protein
VLTPALVPTQDDEKPPPAGAVKGVPSLVMGEPMVGLDPRTGATRGPFAVPGGGTWHATAPDAEDWVLHIDTSG